jgi:hypothetical protein
MNLHSSFLIYWVNPGKPFIAQCERWFWWKSASLAKAIVMLASMPYHFQTILLSWDSPYTISLTWDSRPPSPPSLSSPPSPRPSFALFSWDSPFTIFLTWDSRPPSLPSSSCPHPPRPSFAQFSWDSPFINLLEIAGHHLLLPSPPLLLLGQPSL